MTIKISAKDARQILATAHGLTNLKTGQEGVMQCFEKHPCVQIDSLDVAGCNHDLTIFSRVKNYRRQHLDDLLYSKRRLFDYFCKMMSILPVEKYPLFKWRMDQRYEEYKPYFEQYAPEIERIMNAVKEQPVSSRELKDMGKTEWAWGQVATIANTLLTRLWVAGKLMVHHRERRTRYYALTEDIIPQKHLNAPAPSKDEALVDIAEMIVRASRLVSPSRAPEQWNMVGKVGEVRNILQQLVEDNRVFNVNIKGIDEVLYCPIEDKELWENGAEFADSYVRFLAPLDPLVWNRSLFERIYGHEYVWEVYKKKEDRKYGYYCLPMLFNGDYVGLIEPRFVPKKKVLEIRSLHLFENIDDYSIFKKSFHQELVRFLEYLGAENIENKTSYDWLNKFR